MRCAFLALLCFAISSRADFALRDGDTVVFLGDSITAARDYSKVIETYTLLRFPERKVRFINAGQGGETVKASLDRLQRAVFDAGATVLTVAYGVNDIGWGLKADESHKQEYLAAISQLIDRCQQRGIRVYICSAAITAEAPDRAEQGFLQHMCDEGLALAKAKGAGAIDVQRPMRDVQRRVLAANDHQPDKTKHSRMHAEDGIHLNDLGQMAMAFAILKGLGAPAVVSAAAVDAAHSTVTACSGCQIHSLQCSSNAISFVRLDQQLPLNLQPLWMLHGFYIPIGDQLNRYQLAVTGLAPGRYELRAAGRLLGAWPAAEFAAGLNIASAAADPWEPGGLWDAQGQSVHTLTRARDELVAAQRLVERYLSDHPQQSSLLARAAAAEQAITDLQRALAAPVPIRFTLQKIAD